jgi:membrane protease YdiL (CAAX protease family)
LAHTPRRRWTRSALFLQRALAILGSDDAHSAAVIIESVDVRNSVLLEVAAIGILTAVFLATFRVRPPYVDFALAFAAVALIVGSAARSKRLWSASPPRYDRTATRAAWLAAGTFTAVALLALGLLGLLLARRAGLDAAARFGNWHLALAAALYLPWALLQQYIFQSYLFGRLLHVLRVPVATAVTAVAFASVHFPRWPIMALTLLAGAVWATLYYRYRRLLPLAVSHALLGATLHYWVLGNDLIVAWLP